MSRPGPVLVYLAEDALAIVRERVEGMARHCGLELAGVEIHVITVPSLRLDRDAPRRQLLETARRLRPRLLLLDPLVRLHGVDENNAGEVGDLLTLLNHRTTEGNVTFIFAASDEERNSAVALKEYLEEKL